MRRHVVWIGAVLLAALCVRLGFWQLTRYHEKKARADALEERRSAAPLSWDEAVSLPVGRVMGRRVRVAGRWDPARHILLAYRERDGAPGVELVTPLLPDRGPRVLVNRGWLPAEDGMRARPQDRPESGRVEVVGVVDSFARAGYGLFPLESDSVQVFSARALVRDTVLSRWPDSLAGFVLWRLPEPGAPPWPRRGDPERPDLGMHLGYAFQWFTFAAVILAGGIGLSLSLRARKAAVAVLGSRLRSDSGDPSPPTP